MGMKRSDVCPSCGTTLRYEPPDEFGCGSWLCPRCKYRRPEGSPINPCKFLRKKKVGEVGMKCKDCKYWQLEDELPGITAFMECTRIDENDPDWWKKWHWRGAEDSCEHGERK